jgi:hypothetical protein
MHCHTSFKDFYTRFDPDDPHIAAMMAEFDVLSDDEQLDICQYMNVSQHIDTKKY